MKKYLQICLSLVLVLVLLYSYALAVGPETVPQPEDVSFAEEQTVPVSSAEKIYVSVGDVDFDQEITAADARIALRISAALHDGSTDQSNAADFNRDGFVFADDARTILRVSAKLDEPSSVLILVVPLSDPGGEHTGQEPPEESSSRVDPPEESSSRTEPQEESSTKTDIPVYSFDDSKVLSASAALYDVSAGRFLYEKNSHKHLEPASMTKIMTAYVAAAYFEPDDIITVGNELNYVESNTSRANIYRGQKMTFENMLYCLLLPSGCDAAYTLAVNTVRKALGRNDLSIQTEINTFIKGMNKAAVSLGMNDTHFACPDGFPTDGHYTSAYDLAVLARYAFNKPVIRKVVSTARATVYNSDGSYFNTFTNTNDLIVPGGEHYIDYIRGIKTGWHSGIGQCLTAAAVKNTNNGERILIAVAMGCDNKTDRYKTLKYLFDTAFSK